MRNPFPRLASFSNLKDKIELEDSISLAPIYCAFKLNESDQNVYSYPFINFLQKISSPDQLNSISLSLENSKSQLHPQISLENKLADTQIRVPYVNGGIIIIVYFFYWLAPGLIKYKYIFKNFLRIFI